MSKTSADLLAQARDHAKAAREIATKADDGNRKMTATEQRDFERHFKQATDLKTKADAAAREEDVLAQAKGIAAQVGNPIGGPTSHKSGHGRVTSPWAAHVADQLAAKAGQVGVKALVSGSIDVAAPLAPGVVEIPDFPRRLVDLVLDREAITGNVYTYARQTARTSNAAPVADGAVKPTSTYTFTGIEDRARVIAHLTDPIPERLLADHATVERVLADEMESDLTREVEDQIVAGNGTGENLTGVLSTSGTVAVPFATDLLTTCRKARTLMDDIGEVPTAWCFSSADLEAIDLMRDNSGGAGTGQFMVNTSTLANVFGELPRIGVPSLPTGTALLADWRQARLIVREDARLDADRSGDNFRSNQVQLRCEGRYGFACLRPQAFAVVDLTAA